MSFKYLNHLKYCIFICERKTYENYIQVSKKINYENVHNDMTGDYLNLNLNHCFFFFFHLTHQETEKREIKAINHDEEFRPLQKCSYTQDLNDIGLIYCF